VLSGGLDLGCGPHHSRIEETMSARRDDDAQEPERSRPDGARKVPHRWEARRPGRGRRAARGIHTWVGRPARERRAAP